MNDKLADLAILGAGVIAGYPLGRALAAISWSGRWLPIVVGLVGAAMFLAGSAGADHDQRFRLLAAGGIGLQLAGFVSATLNRRKRRRTFGDLWGRRKPL